MKKSVLIFLAFILTACSTTPPQVTVTVPPPTDTPIPTPTFQPQFIALQEQIAQSGRFTLNPDGTIQDGDTSIPSLHVAPDGTLTLTVDGQEVILEKDSYIFGGEDGLSIEGFKLVDRKWEAVMSETAISTTIEGNKFSGEAIELKVLNEITLAREDLGQMADILDQLAKEGKISTTLVDPRRGPIEIGSSADNNPDLIMDKAVTSWRSMYGVSEHDRTTFRWQEPGTRPQLVAYNSEYGVIFAQMMTDKNGELRVVGWLLSSPAWDNHYNNGTEVVEEKILNYSGQFGKTIAVPMDFAEVEACIGYAETESMRTVCEEIVTNRTALRRAYTSTLTTGEVQANLRSGELLTLLGFVPATR